jgi:hypothetical protein
MNQDEATALPEAKGFIERAISMGRYDPQTGAPLPAVYRLLQQALAATTFDRFAELCAEANRELDAAPAIEPLNGFEMSDAVRFPKLAIVHIFDLDEDD